MNGAWYGVEHRRVVDNGRTCSTGPRPVRTGAQSLDWEHPGERVISADGASVRKKCVSIHPGREAKELLRSDTFREKSEYTYFQIKFLQISNHPH